MCAATAIAEFPPLSAPEFIREDLPNGMTLLAAEHKEQPVVFFDLMVRAGTLHEPKDKTGLAGVVSDMLQEGTEQWNSSELAEQMDRLGGRFSVSAHRESTWVTAQVLKRNSEQALDMVTELVRRPTFPKSELRRVKQQQRAMLRSSYANQDFIGSRHLTAMLYGENLPFGRFATDRSIKSIRREDLLDFYDQNFHATGSIMAIIGDCDPKEMIESVKKRFADWRSGEPVSFAKLPDSFQYKPGRRLAIKRGLSQATILIGGRGVPALSDDFETFSVANHILGASGFSSRLMNAVRSEEGKTYGIRSSNSGMPNVGTFTIQTFTRNDQTRETIEIIRKVIAEASKDGLTEDELAKAKAAIIGGFPLAFESPQEWASTAMQDLFMGREMGFSLQYRERIAKITLEEINEVLRKSIDLDNLAIVVVGDPKELEDQLKGFGDFEVKKEKDWY